MTRTARVLTLSRPNRGRITAAGIQPTRSLALQVGAHYYIGASSSPHLVIVTRIDGAAVELLEPYSGERSTSARWIAEDLIAQGCETFCRTYAKHCPDAVERILDILAGKSVEVGPMSAWDRIVITVRAADGTDRWRDAEEYGNVAGLNDTDLLEITGFRSDVEQIATDARFVVVGLEVSRKAA
jgi:hypothetical protein